MGVAKFPTTLLLAPPPTESGWAEETTFVVEELACVVRVAEVETDEGGVSTEEPGLIIASPTLGGLCWTRG